MTREYRPTTGDALLIIAALPVSMLWGGVVLSVVWNWYMPLVFPDIRLLTVGTAIGLGFVKTAMFYGKTQTEPAANILLRAALEPAILFGLASIAHVWIH